MAVKKDIFKALGDYLMLNATNLPDGLPNLKWVDKQMGQFTDPATAFALPLPTVLISFLDFDWETIGKGVQKGMGSIRIEVYFENYANSFTGSLNQELALQFWEFTEDVIHKLLQGYAIKDLMSPMSRIRDAEDAEQDMIITSTMEYAVTIFDGITDETRNFIDVDPDLIVEYKKESSRPVPDSENKTFLI